MPSARNSKKRALESFVDAVNSQEPVNGYTHRYYRYPARFSPLFPRAAIEAFTKPGDLILDPFMGSGTTLVEATALGRLAIGSDINSLAKFLARLKTTTLSENDLTVVCDWAEGLRGQLGIREQSRPAVKWDEAGYQLHLPWRHRKVIEMMLDRIGELPLGRQQQFARGVVLKLSQWALDCRQQIPQMDQFRNELYLYLNRFVVGMRQYRRQVFDSRLSDGRKPTAVCLQSRAADLPLLSEFSQLKQKPNLVVTSPPYPGVYVLYHRWKVRGRKETPAPYWLADCLDGHGQSHYCLGDRKKKRLGDYFNGINKSFTGVREVISPTALVVQMVSFKQPTWQIPAYLSAMSEAGYTEIMPSDLGIPVAGRLWRLVPGRRWFALIQGKLKTSRELVLFHRPT
jgi:DNA modification methylase